MFRIDKLTQKAQEALQQSQALAESAESQVMFPLHLLISLADEKEGIVRPLLEKCGVRPDAIVAEARRLLGNLPKTCRRPARHLSFAAAQPGAGARLRRSRSFQGRIRFHRAPAALASPSSAATRRASFSTAPAPPTTPSCKRAGSGARHAARHRSESRIEIPGARALRPRPHRVRPQGQARPGDRPRRRNPPRHAGAQPPHQEQPGADRRARRGQDRHRGRPGAAHRARRRARPVEEQAAGGDRPRFHDRRHQVPRRVRRPPEGRGATRSSIPTAKSSASSTSCTRWWARAGPKAPSTPPTC